MDALDVLSDAALRPLRAAERLGPHLTPDVLNAHIADHPNSVAWLLWHTGREIDVQVAALTGGEEVWERGGFSQRFQLGDVGDSLGYGHSADEARAVKTEDGAGLLDYLEGATEALVHYINSLSQDELDHVIDHEFDPPVTRGIRLVSIIDDAAQHVGQAAYVVGALTADHGE